nr:MAG TPA: hypothetical protein [Caudoviricetes sp.]
MNVVLCSFALRFRTLKFDTIGSFQSRKSSENAKPR